MISVEFRDAATSSLLDQSEYFASTLNASLAQRSESAADRTILDLKRFPNSGSPCFFRHPELAELRVSRSPVSLDICCFNRFMEAANLIPVFDIVHGARDIEALMTPPTSEE